MRFHKTLLGVLAVASLMFLTDGSMLSTIGNNSLASGDPKIGAVSKRTVPDTQAVNKPGHSQTSWCATDELLQKRLRDEPGLKERMEALEVELQKTIRDLQALRPASHSGNFFVIPVVVHVIHESGTPLGTAENISDAQIQSQIEALNRDFSNMLSSIPGAEDTQIEFCLVQNPPSGSGITWPGMPGVTRRQSALTDHDLDIEEATLKALDYFPSNQYLNIWVVRDIIGGPGGVLGYARFPGTVLPELDGIVMRYDAFGSNSFGSFNLLPANDDGKVLTHEAGHYLNLFHTFQGGCAGPNDQVADTPPVSEPNFGCPLGTDSCANDAELDQVENFLDYTTDVCRNTFTVGQTDRMHAAILNFRSTLVNPANLVQAGCSSGSAPTMVADVTQICTGDVVTFETAASAVDYVWGFPGGIPDSATGPGPHSVTYNSAGAYNVSLTITDASNNSNSLTLPNYIYVSDCAPITGGQAQWYFPDQAGLDFRSGIPKPVLGGQITTIEAAASQSDSNGELLFYTNGGQVWDRTHTPMPNGSGLLGNGSAHTGVLILPVPLSSNTYFVFTVPANEDGPVTDPLRYSVVDMTLNAGLGDIVPGMKNLVVLLPVPGVNRLIEGVTAIPHCNGTDFWVITQGAGSADRTIFVTLVTPAGPVSTTAFPNIGCPTNTFSGGLQATIAGSPDGSLFAIQVSFARGYRAVYKFDRTTGTVTPFIGPTKGNHSGSVSFSPDSKLLYGTTHDGFLNYSVIQTDLATLEERVVTTTGALTDLQLGPDDKLYICKFGSSTLGVINYPNNFNTNNANECGLNISGVSLGGPSTIFSLPNFMDARSAALTSDFDYSIVNCSEVSFFNRSCGTSFLWDFGDGASSTDTNPTHTYAQTGIYTVTLTVQDGSSPPTIFKQVTVGIDPPDMAGPPDTCDSFTNYSTNPLPGISYSWQISGGTPASATGDNVDVTWGSAGGTVTLTATDPTTGCQASTTLNVVPCSGAVDIALTKSVSDPNPAPGSQITYTITVSNLGPINAHNILVEDLLPSQIAYMGHSISGGTATYNSLTGDLSIPSLDAQDSITLEIIANALCSEVENCVELVRLDETDINTENNKACVTIMLTKECECVEPPLGMVGWWPGDGHADDIQGGNHGTLFGATFTTGLVDQAFSFDGANDFVSLPPKPVADLIADQFTIDFWANPGSVADRPTFGFSGSGSLNTNNPIASYDSFLTVGDGTGGFQLLDPLPTAPANIWTHYVIVDDGTDYIVYVNGIEQYRAAIAVNPASGSNREFVIGESGFCCGLQDRYKGTIDEVEIFNRALTRPTSDTNQDGVIDCSDDPTSEICQIFLAGSAGKCKPGPCVDPPDGMVGWWPGDGTAEDISGFNNHGIVASEPYDVGKVQEAFCFGSGMVVPDAPSLNFGAVDPGVDGSGNFSIDLWVKAKTNTATFPQILVQKSDTNNDLGYNLFLSGPGNGYLSFQLGDATSTIYQSITPQAFVADQIWHHVAVTVNRDDPCGGKLYVDGNPVPITSGPSVCANTFDPTGHQKSITNTVPLQIAPFAPFVPGPLCIDELEIFNRSLDPSEIQSIFNADSAGKCKPGPCAPPPDDMVSWWDADSVSGTTAFDIWDGNDGTMLSDVGIEPAGKVGSAFSFPGTGGFNRIEIPDDPSLREMTSITIDAWIKAEPGGDDETYTIVRRDTGQFEGSTAPRAVYALELFKGQLHFQFTQWDNPNKTTAATCTTCPDIRGDGLWHHVAVVRDTATGRVRAYLDGKEVIKITDKIPPSKNFVDPNGSFFSPPILYIGDYFTGNPQINSRFKGLIDEVEIFNRALTRPTSDTNQDGVIDCSDDPTSEICQIFLAGSAGKCKGAICGMKFNDLDGDGDKDDDEGLAGWTIFIDTNGDGILNNPVSGDGVCDANATEPCVITDEDGNYCFTDLEPGTYTVAEVMQGGWKPTTPPAVNVNVTQDQVAHVDFGNQQEVDCDLVNVTSQFTGQDCCWDLTVSNNSPGPLFGIRATAVAPVTFASVTSAAGWGQAPSSPTTTVTWTRSGGNPIPTGSMPLAIICLNPGTATPQEVIIEWLDAQGNVVCTQNLFFDCPTGPEPCIPAGGDGRVIDFETLPDGTPTTDGMLINTQYKAAFGVTFALSDGADPVIAKVGGKLTAFGGPNREEPACNVNQSTNSDMPAPGQGVACSFLTVPNVPGGLSNDPPTLIVIYDTPVSQSSGVLIDIDIQSDPERWTITAYDIGNIQIGQVVLSQGDPGTGNGIATPWSFSFSTPQIRRLEFDYTGGTDHGVGLAFDNFAPSAVPCTGEIHGVKWNDLDGDGGKNDNEPELEGWTIFIDANGDGILNNPNGDGICDANATEPCVITDEAGNYWLMDVPAPGTYTVAEVLQPGWTQTFPASGTHTVELAPDQVVEGVDFGNWQPASITVIKQVEGQAPASDWQFGGTLGNFSLPAAGGQSSFPSLTPGTYMITETTQSGYTTTVSCSNLASGTNSVTFTLNAGDNVTCTYTNTQQGSITIIKDAVPDDEQDFNFSGSLGNFALDDDTNVLLSNQKTVTGLNPGAYTVTESGAPPGWTFTSLVCTDPDHETTVNGQTANIDLDPGETVTCTFTNTKQGTIIINKTAVNGDNTFSYSGDLGNFSITTTGGTGSQTFNNVPPGTVTVTEQPPPPGWVFTELDCTNATVSGQTASIVLAPGETVTCTYTNTHCAPPPPGMVAWWPFDTDQLPPPPIAFDLAPPANNGTPMGGVNLTAPGKVSNSYEFDGVNDFVQVTSAPSLNFSTGSFAIDAWIMPDDVSGRRTIVSKIESFFGFPAPSFKGYTFFVENGQLKLTLNGRVYDGPAGITPGDWHHVAVSVCRNPEPIVIVIPSSSQPTIIPPFFIVDFYIDGMKNPGGTGIFCTGTACNPPSAQPVYGDISNSADLVIGGVIAPPLLQALFDPFTGNIDELEIFNTCLAESDVKAIFEAGSLGKCRPPRIRALADLVPRDLQVNPEIVPMYGQAEATFTIRNEGEEEAIAAEHEVQLVIFSPERGARPVPVARVSTRALAPGASQPFRVPLPRLDLLTPTPLLIRVTADAPDAISESNEENNTAELATGLLQLSAICGTKFNDLDGNGRKDAGEPGVPGWQIILSDAQGNRLATTITDENGQYCFMSLAPGTYKVSEEGRDGWQQTFPSAPGTHSVNLGLDQTVTNIDFGNEQVVNPCDFTSISTQSTNEECCVTLTVNNNSPVTLFGIRATAVAPVTFVSATPAAGWAQTPSSIPFPITSLTWTRSASGPIPTGSAPLATICLNPGSAASQEVVLEWLDERGNVLCAQRLAFDCPPAVCCDVSPRSIDFGQVCIGQSVERTFTVTNCGSLPFTLNAITSSNPAFSIVSPALPVTVPAGGQVTVTVRLTCATPGQQTGRLSLVTESDAGPIDCGVVNVTGTCVLAACDVSPRMLDFGQVEVGQSATQSLTVRNTGTTNFTLNAITSSNPAFSVVSPPLPIVLPPGASVTVTVQLTCTTPGTQTGALTFSTSSACGSVDCGAVTLTGSCAEPACPALDLRLNTGRDEMGNLLGPGQLDGNWQITADPDPNTSEPRPAIVINPQTGWQPPLANSQWISVSDNGRARGGDYEYQTCFCLDDGFQNARLSLNLRADDRATVFLNGVQIGATPEPSANTPTPTPIEVTNQELFRAGENCLKVVVTNRPGLLGAPPTGLNLAGTITAERGLCCKATSTIRGIKYEDQNGNGQRDVNGQGNASEPVLPGWVITLTDGQSVNLSATTNVEGKYELANLAPGTYTLSEMPQPGWTPTQPPSGSYTVTLRPGQVLERDFGNRQGGAGSPDFVVKQLLVIPPTIACGRRVVVRFRIANEGTGAAGPAEHQIRLVFRVEGAEDIEFSLGTVSTNALAAGAFQTFNLTVVIPPAACTLFPALPPPGLIRVIADFDEKVDESNEENNVGEFPVIITLPG